MLVKNKKKPASFVFNSYKNSGRLGSQIVEIPNNLKSIITKWKEKNPYDYLIVNSKFNKITQIYINSFLNDIFGKRISSSLLRHIWVTNKYGNVDLEQMKKDTHDLGQSNPERLLKYVSKKDATKE
jgi:hypothetical protein